MSTFETGHVGINVTDLARSRDFYRGVFGFQVVHESQESGRQFALLGDGEKLVLTLWQQSRGRFDTGAPGLHHLSFQVADIAQVESVEKALRAQGVRFLHEGIVPHSEGAQSGGIFFEDPDGVRLEIFAPTGAGEHAAPTPGAPSCGFF